MSTAMSRIGVPGLQGHVLQRLGGRRPVGLLGERLRVGHRAPERHALAGVGAPGDERA